MDRQLGYIVERVISQKTQTVHWNGKIDVQGLEPWLNPPFAIEGIEVEDIRQICCEREAHECCFPQKGKERIQLCLICRVMDTCGRIAKGKAQIQLPVCTESCTGNIRRGAQVKLKHACFCGRNTFEICMEICIHTVVSRSEFMQMSRQPERCRQLPLYPHASVVSCRHN